MSNWEKEYYHYVSYYSNAINLFKSGYNGKPIKAIITGGGFWLSNILTLPGASKFIDSINIPYSVQSINSLNPKFIDTPKLCSEDALKIYEETIDPDGLNKDFSYVCVTSALSSDRERRGDNVSFISINKKRYKINFSKIDWNSSDDAAKSEFRRSQDCIIGLFILGILSNKLDEIFNSDFKNHYEEINDPFDIYSAIISKRNGYFTCKNNKYFIDSEFTINADKIYPGSFNPYHAAHDFIYSKMAGSLNSNCYLEISKSIKDKGEIKDEDLLKRIDSLKKDKNIIISSASLFFEKMQLFPYCNFYLGSDTFKRIIDKDTKHDIEHNLVNSKCYLIVFKRDLPEIEDIIKDYKNCTLHNEDFPNELRSISSTKIREVSK